jgi:hypothetical protein
MHRDDPLRSAQAETRRTQPGPLLALRIIFALVLLAALALADEALTQGEVRRALGSLFDGTS